MPPPSGTRVHASKAPAQRAGAFDDTPSPFWLRTGLLAADRDADRRVRTGVGFSRAGPGRRPAAGSGDLPGRAFGQVQRLHVGIARGDLAACFAAADRPADCRIHAFVGREDLGRKNCAENRNAQYQASRRTHFYLQGQLSDVTEAWPLAPAPAHAVAPASAGATMPAPGIKAYRTGGTGKWH